MIGVSFRKVRPGNKRIHVNSILVGLALLFNFTDDAIDEVLRELRAIHPDAPAGEESLVSLINILDGFDHQGAI